MALGAQPTQFGAMGQAVGATGAGGGFSQPQNQQPMGGFGGGFGPQPQVQQPLGGFGQPQQPLGGFGMQPPMQGGIAGLLQPIGAMPPSITAPGAMPPGFTGLPRPPDFNDQMPPRPIEQYSQVEQLYRNILGRPSDQGGLDYWTQQFGSEVDKDEYNRFLSEAQKELANRPMPVPRPPVFDSPIKPFPITDGPIMRPPFQPVSPVQPTPVSPIQPTPIMRPPIQPTPIMRPPVQPISPVQPRPPMGGSVFNPLTGTESRDLRPLRPGDPRLNDPMRRPQPGKNLQGIGALANRTAQPVSRGR